MNILVTGANGFTGRFFCELAKSAGHHIVALQSDLTDRKALTDEVTTTKPEAIVHLAAISFVGHADPTAFYAVNVVGTTNLLAAALHVDGSLKNILLASSANIYGNTNASPIKESQPPSPVNHYGASKLAMEHMAQTYADRLPIILTRPFNYTGPGQSLSFVVPKLVDHFNRKAASIELGNVNVEREFNDIRMISHAYLALTTHGEAGQTYNICSGEPHTLQQVINTLVDLTGHKPAIRVNDKFVRSNEVHRLCGDPSRLTGLLERKNTHLPKPSLKETLSWMLREATI